MANTLPIEITADLADIKKKLDELKDYTQGWGFQIKQALTDAFTGKALEKLKDALSDLKAEFSSWIAAAEESEQIDKRLDIAVRNVGGALGWTSAQIKQMASDMQDLSTSNDEEIKAAATRIIQLGLTGQKVRETLQASVDLAAGGPEGTTLMSAAESLARAMELPANAARALKGAGILLTEQQRDQIEAFAAAGDKAAAQAAILDAVRSTYHGLAQEMTGTWRGMKAQLANLADDIRESLGGGLVELLEKLEPALKAILIHVKGLADHFKEWFTAILGGATSTSIIDHIKDGVIGLFAIIETLFARLPNYFEIALAKIKYAIQEIRFDIAKMIDNIPLPMKVFLGISASSSAQERSDSMTALGEASKADRAAQRGLNDRGSFSSEWHALADTIRAEDQANKEAIQQREAERDKVKDRDNSDPFAAFDALEEKAKGWAEHLGTALDDQLKRITKTDAENKKKAEENKKLDDAFAEMQQRMADLVQKQNHDVIQDRMNSFRFQSSIEDGGSVFRRVQTAAASIDPNKDVAASSKGAWDELKLLNAKIDANRNKRNGAVWQ